MVQIFRRARSLAFQALFEAEFDRTTVPQTLEREQARTPLPDTDLAFAERIIQGVAQHRAALDQLIARTAPAWPVAQLAIVDRTVLRIALYELLFNNAAVPVAVAINEAVELAKRYGSEASGRFVNGVLGSVSRQHLTTPLTPTAETEDSRGPV